MQGGGVLHGAGTEEKKKILQKSQKMKEVAKK